MSNDVSQHVRHLCRHLGFFKKIIFSKTVANILEIGRKHVLNASKMDVINNTLEKKNLDQILSKRYHFVF